MVGSPSMSATAVAVLLLLFCSAAAAAAEAMTTLALERAIPHGASIDELLAHDRGRHRRLLIASSSTESVVDFPVEGSANPFSVGLYYTHVKLGNPAKEFYVQIDTGSDILWVSCVSCSGCPTKSGLNIELEYFDPSKSSTASQIICSDSRCASAFQTGEASCPDSGSSNSPCSYQFQYGDGSSTSGYYVSDTLLFGTVTGNEQTGNSSATVIFGCSNSQSGDLTKSDRAVDGIFGFGQQELSVISQLSSKGVAPKAFSHCLKGSDNGGGILVLGEIVEPGLVYTPLVPSQPHYNLNLTSISVDGQKLPIDPSLFLTSNNQGTIIDSGTTLAYLAEDMFDPFVNAVTASVSSSVTAVASRGTQCFLTSSSIGDTFPAVTLTFEGGAVMELKPQDYLLQQGYIENVNLWCIGWQKNSGQRVTILGDIVLKDKIVVYDLANQRIGWTDYNCSSSVNVTVSSIKNEFINTGSTTVSSSSSSHTAYSKLPVAGFAVLLVHILLYTLIQL